MGHDSLAKYWSPHLSPMCIPCGECRSIFKTRCLEKGRGCVAIFHWLSLTHFVILWLPAVFRLLVCFGERCCSVTMAPFDSFRLPCVFLLVLLGKKDVVPSWWLPVKAHVTHPCSALPGTTGRDAVGAEKTGEHKFDRDNVVKNGR
jgi:hypothetical protein